MAKYRTQSNDFNGKRDIETGVKIVKIKEKAHHEPKKSINKKCAADGSAKNGRAKCSAVFLLFCFYEIRLRINP